MVRSELSVAINVPPEQVFARFSEPMHAMKDIPNVIEVKDITGHGVGMNWKEIYKMAGVHLKIDCTFIDYVVNKRTTIQAKGAINATLMYEVGPLETGSRLRISGEYEIPIPLVGKIAESLLKKHNEREWQAMLDNLKARLEAETPATVD